MVMEEIITEACERLNLTSDTARSRVAREINNRYKRITSSIGLVTSRFTSVTALAVIGNRTMTFTGIEKITAVVDKSDPSQDIVLGQLTPDEMHITPIRTEPPRNYAITRMHGTSVEVELDCLPATAFTLYADGYVTVTSLSGSDVPDFPESFHDILVWGVMADEYRKMEKMPLMIDAEQNYEKRLSDLRMFIAKSAYLDIYQGRYNGKAFRWTRDNQLSWD